MAPDIRPSSDLRNHYAEISRVCREERRPTILTVNGRGDTVLLGLEEYDRMVAELDLLNALAESERDVAEGRIGSGDDVVDSLQGELDKMRQMEQRAS